MNIKVFPNPEILAQESVALLQKAIAAKPDSIICFAAGGTQTLTYRLMVEKVKAGELDMSRLRILGLDEIVGADRQKREGFRYYLDERLFTPCGIREEQITFINPCGDMDAECARINAWLDANGPIDIVVLGVGGNGHIGYNEPGSDPSSRTRVMQLEASSVAAGAGYFDHDFDQTRGVTLGLADLLQTRHILVQASGAAKAAAVAAVRAGTPTSDTPVTLLLTRKEGVEFYIDEAASAGK